MTRSNANTSADARQQMGHKPETAPPQPKQLPPYRVLLHNDDDNSMEYVTQAIFQLTPLNWPDARSRMQEADSSGVALLVTTHKERAELYQEQFASKGLSVTIEPDSA